MSCLDDETIAAFAETRLPPERIAALEAHVRDCASCRELVSLALAAAQGGGATGEWPGSSAPRGSPAEAAASEAGLLARGAAIGRYTVLELVGRGGMGEVYAAYDPELDRKVALKILNGGAGSADGRGGSRLLREAKAIARLRHPNVVVVHDAGSFADHLFIAMEYVDGRTLAAWLAERPRTPQEILQVFLAAGRGLQAAHAAGLVHRDFKPQNVMVCADGDVRVMDFGLARAVDAPLDAAADGAVAVGPPLDAGLTQTGELLGTPLYMAPEQFAGQRTDARTDQFSFCVALYQALYGSHPFGGKQLVELMAAVVVGQVQAPPPKSAVPPWLRRILLRGLSPEPAQRFPSMGDLLAALDRRPAVRRRRRIALAAGALLVAALAAGAQRVAAPRRATCDGGPMRSAGAWTPARRDAIRTAFLATASKSAPTAFERTAALLDAYVARWTGLFRESCEATHVRGEQSSEVLDLRMACLDESLASVRALGETLASADAAVVERAIGAAAALPPLDRCNDVAALRAIVKPPDDQATRRKVGELREQLATIKALSAAGRCEQATHAGRPIAAAAKQLGYVPLQAEISYALGRRFDSCSDLDAALADMEDAVMYAEASRYDEIAIEAAAMLAGAHAERAPDPRAARRWLRLAEAILARFPGHPLLEARVTACRSIVLLGEDRLEEALAEGRRALALQESSLGPTSLDAIMSANNVAIVLHELGRDAEAEGYIRRVVDTTRATFGGDSTRFAVASLNESEILTALGRFEAAHAAVDGALALWREHDAGGFYLGYALLDRGRLELAEGRTAAAVATLEEALRLLDKLPRYGAEARFALARALVAASASADSRGRAAALARDARAALAEDRSAARLVREIDRWRREHPPG